MTSISRLNSSFWLGRDLINLAQNLVAVSSSTHFLTIPKRPLGNKKDLFYVSEMLRLSASYKCIKTQNKQKDGLAITANCSWAQKTIKGEGELFFFLPHEIIQGTPVLTSWRVIEKSNVADRNTFSQGSRAKEPRLNLKR